MDSQKKYCFYRYDQDPEIDNVCTYFIIWNPIFSYVYTEIMNYFKDHDLNFFLEAANNNGEL